MAQSRTPTGRALSFATVFVVFVIGTRGTDWLVWVFLVVVLVVAVSLFAHLVRSAPPVPAVPPVVGPPIEVAAAAPASDAQPPPTVGPAPVARPQSDARSGVLAPDVLTGHPTAPRSIAEGWYVTADGTRERWHNGAGWTAHQRAPGGS